MNHQKNESPENLLPPGRVIRTATDVINQAIRENRFSEYLLYMIALLLVVVGIIVIMVGVFQKDALATIAGSISSSLFIPSMSFARTIRRENIALRLLEVPLSGITSSEKMIELIRNNFSSVNKDRNWKTSVFKKD